MTDISAIIKVFMEPGLKTNGSGPAPLRPGSVITGRVTHIFPGGVLKVNFGKFRTQARVKFPAAKGDLLRFEVLASGDPIKLKIQNPPPATSRAPIERFSLPEDLYQLRTSLERVLQKPGAPRMARGTVDSTGRLLSQLDNLLRPLPAGSGADRLAPLIKAILSNSGVFFEKKLETVLLQIFKTPYAIDPARASSHPFVTHIFDGDLKPNLLKLAARLANPGNDRKQSLSSLREPVLKVIGQIDAAQTRLTQRTGSGTARTAGTYHRHDSVPAGPALSKAPGLNADGLKALRQQLLKSGLWADPEIRAAVRELSKTPEQDTSQRSAAAPSQKTTRGQVFDRLHFNGQPTEKAALQTNLAGLLKSSPAQQSKALGTFLNSFQAYVRASRLSLDPETKTALTRLGRISRNHATRIAVRPGVRPDAISSPLRILARCLESHPAPTRQAAFPVAGLSGRTSPPDKRGALPGSHARPAFSDPLSPATAGQGRPPIAVLLESKAAALQTELGRIDSVLAGAVPVNTGRPDGKSLAAAVRNLRAVIARHQLPAGETVSRALTTVAAREPSAGRAAMETALKSAPLAERRHQELLVLREFIGQQRAELNETLDMMKTLLNRAAKEADPVDRPGSDRGRGTDPMQVITFSLPMEEGQKAARLKVFYPSKRRAAADSPFRISLLLSLDRMGPIRADISAYRKNLEIKFSTESESARRHIGDHFNLLRKLLSVHFETVNLTAAVDEKTLTAFEFEDLELSPDRLVDLKA